MIYYNLKPIDILQLKLQWQIGELKEINTQELFNFLDSQEEPLVAFCTLFHDTNMYKKGFSQIYNYCKSITTTVSQKYHYSNMEQQFIHFYIFLLSLKEPIPYVTIVYNLYQTLAPILQFNLNIPWVSREIIIEMMPYYIYLNLDTDILVQELEKINI